MSAKPRSYPLWPIKTVMVLVALALVVYVSAPVLARRYITSHYSGVTVGSVEIHWGAGQAVLRDVVVERPNLHAKLPLVEVDRQKNVLVTGGTVEATIGSGQGDHSSDPPGGTHIVANKLEVTAHYKDASADLKNVRLDETEVCFESGTITHPKVTATVRDACMKRDKSFARASVVEVPVELPFDLPKLARSQVVSLREVQIEPEKKTVRFERVLVDAHWKSDGDVEVSRTWLAVQGPASVVAADDKIILDSPKVEVDHPWLAAQSVEFEAVKVEAPKNLKGQVDVTVGGAHVHLDATDKAVMGAEPCDTWLGVFPKPLPEAMQKLQGHFTGELSFEVRVQPPKVELKSTCRVDCKAAPIREILGPKFTYAVYDAKNELVDREAGPTVEGWIRLGNLPPHVPKAFVLLEDPGFPVHHGVIAQALENSLKIDVEKGSFAKGGSTITMQLARNLWLGRYKSLGRKAEEALLAYALESCLTKEQILELYVNVIEFGPDLYGIGPAAKHYFKKDASDLSAEEGFYLASILPAPKKALPPKKGGLARAKRIMKALATSGFLSEYMVEDDTPADTAGWEAAD